jgi:hypothetical protein
MPFFIHIALSHVHLSETYYNDSQKDLAHGIPLLTTC